MALDIEYILTGLSIPDVDGRPWEGPGLGELARKYPDGFYFVTRFYNRLYRTLVESGVSAKVTPISEKPTYHNFFYIEPKRYPEVTDQWNEPSPVYIFKGRDSGSVCANNSEA